MSVGVRPRILFLAHLLPWPLHGGGQVKTFHTLRSLATRYDVTLLAFSRPGDDVDAAMVALSPICAGGAQVVPLPRGWRQNVRALRSRLSFVSLPLLIGRDSVEAMREAGRREWQARRYAAVHLDHLQMFWNGPANWPGVHPTTYRAVLDQHNVEHRILQRLAESPGFPTPLRLLARWEWPGLQDHERGACRSVHRVLTVSEADRAAMIALQPDELTDSVVTVPIGVDVEHFEEAPTRRPDAATLLSVGTMYWPPNAEGAVWFCREVLPLVRRERPDVGVSLVGPKPTKAVRGLAALPGVTVHGAVPDVRPFAADCGAFLVPLHAGSGVRVKILTAWAMGLPVVSTRLGAEGLDAEDGCHLLLADTPEKFARAVLRVLSDPALAARLGEEGRALVRREHSVEAAGSRLLAVYDALLGGVPA